MKKNLEGTKFQTVKRVSALILVAVLILMYAATMYFAITDRTETMNFFWASVALTIFVPVLLYAYQLVYRVLKGRGVNAPVNVQNDSDNVTESK